MGGGLDSTTVRSKRSLAAASKRRTKRRLSSSKSKLMNCTSNYIDHLSDVVLVDILCRLPCFEFVFKCKSVSKRWRNLLSDPYFIGRFVFRLQRGKNTPPLAPPIPPLLTLINQKGENFPKNSIALVHGNDDPPSLGRPKFLARLFKRLMSCIPLEKEPVVVGACNDLVLCCASECRQRDYFICNPYTTEWVALPPVSKVLQQVPVGFICDPYYSNEVHNKKNNDYYDGHPSQLSCIKINVDYRCRVVRILPFDDDDLSYTFKVEIFSFETGEWKVSTIALPDKISFYYINSDVHFAHNGKLYWLITSLSGYALIGLDPFSISDDTNDNIIKECHFIVLTVPKPVKNIEIQGLGVPGGGGCLQICVLDRSNMSVLFWELKQDNEEDLITVRYLDPKGSLDLNAYTEVELTGFDPNSEGCLYLTLDGSLDKMDLWNTRLERGVAAESSVISNCCFFPLREKPWWPTPVPRLQDDAADGAQ